MSETLRYAAQLRIAGLSGAELQARVRAVIGLLRLDVVKDSLVGNALKRGVSGGEKKRVRRVASASCSGVGAGSWLRTLRRSVWCCAHVSRTHARRRAMLSAR